MKRREFLKRTVLTSLPLFVPGAVLGKDTAGVGNTAPSERIIMGLVGCGNHGAGWNLDQMFRNDDSQVIAVSDVDEPRMKRARDKVNRHYTAKVGKDYRGCDTHGDFRDLIRRKDIDAVAVCTPDHWHVIPALMAVKAGKDVICEKPLTLFLEEGRILSDAVKKHDRIFQTASENRSIDTYIRICELVRNGRVGKLKHIRVTLPGGNQSRGENFSHRTVEPVPKGFNYEMWQGPGPGTAVHPRADARQLPLVLPVLRRANHRLGRPPHRPGPSGGTIPSRPGRSRSPARANSRRRTTSSTRPTRSKSTTSTPAGVTMKIVDGTPGIRFEGTEGWIGFDGWRAPLQASDPKILDSKIGPDETHLYRPRVVIGRREGKGGEHRNFIDCVKSRTPCYAPAETGHRTISVSHIGISRCFWAGNCSGIRKKNGSRMTRKPTRC